MHVASRIAAAHDDVPRTSLHGGADAEEIKGDRVDEENYYEIEDENGGH